MKIQYNIIIQILCLITCLSKELISQEERHINCQDTVEESSTCSQKDIISPDFTQMENQQKQNKQVLIIGAGPSGLISARKALSLGLEPIILEQNEEIGGLWHPETGSTWNDLTTNLSKFTCQFSQFPHKETTSIYPSQQELFEYLKNFTEFYKIKQHIKFSTKILKIEKKILENTNNEYNWQVTWQNLINNQEETLIFKNVIICTGIFSGYQLPEIKGIDLFKGKIIHSKDFGKHKDQIKNKKVLVVGGSFSALEVAAGLSKTQNQVYHSFIKPCWVLQKFLPLNPDNIDQGVLPIDLLFYSRKFYQNPTDGQKQTDLLIKKNTYLSSHCKIQQSIPEVKVDENDFQYPQNVGISEDYIQLLTQKKINPIRSEISHFDSENNSIQFKNQQNVDNIDYIIFSTGFNVNLSFLDEDTKKIIKFDQNDKIQPTILYKTILHPELQGLFFVGMYKGPYFSTMEQQANYALDIINGDCQYPNKEEIERGLQEEISIREQNPRPKFPHIDYVKFTDEIASLTNQKLPNIQKLLKSENTQQFIEALNLNTEQLNIYREQLQNQEFQEEIKSLFFENFVGPEDYLITTDLQQFIESKKIVKQWKENNKQQLIDNYKQQNQI